MGDAIVADLRDKMPGKAITEKDLEKRLDNRIRKGDRLLLRTDHNNSYDGGSETWMKTSPYLTIGATMWCIDIFFEDSFPALAWLGFTCFLCFTLFFCPL